MATGVQNRPRRRAKGSTQPQPPDPKLPHPQRALAWHQRDQEYSEEIEAWFCREKPRKAWISAQMILKDATADAELLESFRSAYVLWHHEPDLAGATVDELYFSQFPDRLCGREDWRHAQKRSWLGLWKIQAVDQDRGLRMVDRLTGEKRYAFQRRASTALEPTDTVLGRVVDIDDEVSVLAGVEPIPLPPYAAVAARDGFLRDMFPSHTKLEPVHLRDDVLFMTLKTKWHCATSLWLRAFGADANGRIHDLSKAQSRSRNGRELLEAAGNLLLHA